MKLAEWNALPVEDAVRELQPCGGSLSWASAVVNGRPYPCEEDLLQRAAAVWNSLGEKEWLEAFRSHPKIGEAPTATDRHGDWAKQEQSGALAARPETKGELALANQEYEDKFGFIFIVGASGKSAEEMLASLRTRLHNSREQELREAANQQGQITALRLRKWLSS